jgi:hypothetical protein
MFESEILLLVIFVGLVCVIFEFVVRRFAPAGAETRFGVRGLVLTLIRLIVFTTRSSSCKRLPLPPRMSGLPAKHGAPGSLELQPCVDCDANGTVNIKTHDNTKPKDKGERLNGVIFISSWLRKKEPSSSSWAKQ